MVSRRVGQVTLATSCRTSRKNSIGFFVILIDRVEPAPFKF
jgi:hypothetical protein